MQNIVAPSVAPAPAAPSLTPGAIDYSWLKGDKPTQNLMAPMAPMGMAPMGMAPMGGAQYGTPSGMYNSRMDFGGSADGSTGEGVGGVGDAAGSAAAASAAAADAASNSGTAGQGDTGDRAQGGLISSYRYGGPVHPPYREEARQVAAQGRGPDTQLMHVTPKELRGLASLHPSGQLPRNPQTGLPEAGFLENVLPGILGTVVGSFVGMPWLGAVIGGVGTGLATGDLGKGLLSGLMSFGLGSAFSGLAEAGATAATTEAAKTATAASAANPMIATGSGFGADVVMPATSLPSGGAATFPAGPPTGNFLERAAQGISNIPDKLSNIPNTLSNIGTGLTDPTALTKNALSAGTGLMSAYGLAQASNAPSAWTPAMPQQPTGPTQPTPTNLRTPTGYAPTVATGYGSRTGEGTFFAPNPGFPYMASGGGHVKALATGGVIPRGYDSYEMARGGIASMPSGMIRGPGAGMDDAINGTIDGRREVRLSDGEYVLSADVVSSIGDGSSEAGARRLAKMVENIREKKYGRPKQPGKLAGGLASLGMQAGGLAKPSRRVDMSLTTEDMLNKLLLTTDKPQQLAAIGDVWTNPKDGRKYESIPFDHKKPLPVEHTAPSGIMSPPDSEPDKYEVDPQGKKYFKSINRDGLDELWMLKEFLGMQAGGKVKGGDRSEEVRTALLGERLEDDLGNTYESIGSERPSDFNAEDYGGRFPTYDAKDGKMNINVGGKKYFRTIPPGTLKKYPGHLPLEWMRRIEGFPTS